MWSLHSQLQACTISSCSSSSFSHMSLHRGPKQLQPITPTKQNTVSTYDFRFLYYTAALGFSAVSLKRQRREFPAHGRLHLKRLFLERSPQILVSLSGEGHTKTKSIKDVGKNNNMTMHYTLICWRLDSVVATLLLVPPKSLWIKASNKCKIIQKSWKFNTAMLNQSLTIKRWSIGFKTGSMVCISWQYLNMC